MLERYTHNEQDAWHWRPAVLADVTDIVSLAQTHFQLEMEQIVTPDPALGARNLAIAIITQMHSATQEQVIVARDRVSNTLLAWAWISRGGYTVYSRDELAEARFVHCDLTLSARSRIRLTAQVIQQWHFWCQAGQVAVLVSCTIRADQEGFMHLHERAGFSVRGSYAYMRIKQ
jgi:hypothetical protein